MKFTESTETIDSLDTETIFSLKTRSYVKMIKKLLNLFLKMVDKLLESELRKKFLQPRTTMWRAVKRLERQGIIEILKKTCKIWLN